MIKDRFELQRLERLEQLESLEQLELTNLSYEKVKIEPNAVIYCDIPYKGTETYQEGQGFDYDNFYEWAMNQDNYVFVSEYNMPDEFSVITEIKHRSTLSSTANNEVVEKLFCNKPACLPG